MAPILGIIASGQQAASASSFESIATATGTGSSNTITFSSIPSGYKSLQIRWIGKYATGGAAAAVDFTMQFNSDTATNYAYHYLRGNGTAAAAGGTGTVASIYPQFTSIPNSATALANMHGVGIIDILDYTSTSKNKTLRAISGLNTNGSITGYITLSSGLWVSTSAITSITCTLTTGNWTTTSSFALYGIKG